MPCSASRSKSSQRPARNRGAVVVKSAPHFPEVNPKGVMRLRGYQVQKHDEVLAHLAAGARVVPLVLPTGAGKTTICKAIAAGWFAAGPDRLVIILGPTRAVVRQFQEPGPRIHNGRETVPWRADEDPRIGLPEPTAAQLVDLAWLSTARGIYISTRQAWGRGLMLKHLKGAPFEPDALRNLLVVADEAHHHNPKTAAGKLVAELERRGATIIPVTATPYYEDGSLFPPEVEARAVRLSSTEFALMTDEAGQSFCPADWDFTRDFVGESSDAADAYDTGARLKRGKAQRALEVCRAMAARWQADERPKAIFFLPERAWVAPMQRALAEVGAARDRVVDFTGDDLSDDALALLDRERKVKRYQDSEVDAILSCARFDEGTDWPLCAVGYCWRIPDSVVRVLQRLGRCSRGKARIEGYPERWRNVQTMRFFVRKLTGDGAAEAWHKHGELALVLGLFLADYREALKWARVVGSERGDRQGAAGGDEPRSQEPRETDPLVLAKAKRRAMQLAQRPGAKGGYVVDGLRRDFPSIPHRQAKEIAALVVKGRGVSDEEVARRRAKVRADLEVQALREGRGAGWVREQFEKRFAALMDEVLELPVEADGEVLREIGLRFGAEEVEAFVERFRAAGEGAGFAWPETLEGLIAFAGLHGERFRQQDRWGRYPALSSGQIAGLPVTWNALDHALRAFGSCLRKVFGRVPRHERYEHTAQAAKAFVRTHGREPSRHSGNKEEVLLARALGSVRQNAPEVCDRHGLPRKADKAQAARRSAGRFQFQSLGQVLVRLCVEPHVTAKSKAIGDDSGRTLDRALECAHIPALRGQSRGLAAVPDLEQVNSIARLRAERDADCWCLWLDGADAPDPRPWADILAAGDNARVVRAERVAFLDWANPGSDAFNTARTGRPQKASRRPWPT